MSYIYKITNKINNKIYIGKTNLTIQERFRQHCKDSVRDFDRPLYKAFNKYGILNFSVEQIEECTPEETSDREVYWIEYYGSFKNGYNATKGGDGKPYLDYDLIMKLWNENQSIQKIAELLSCHPESVRNVLDLYHVSHEDRVQRSRENMYHAVAQIDKNTGEIIKVFPSIQAACSALQKQHSGHIAEVCKGTRKSAYGFKWKYI